MSKNHSVLYTSQWEKGVSDIDKQAVYSKALSINREKDITGSLWSVGNGLLHYFEGPEEQVEMLYDRIKKDTRHRDLIEVLKGTCAQRKYDHFFFGTKVFHDLDVEQLNSFNNLKNFDIASIFNSTCEDVVDALTLHFYNSGKLDFKTFWSMDLNNVQMF